MGQVDLLYNSSLLSNSYLVLECLLYCSQNAIYYAAINNSVVLELKAITLYVSNVIKKYGVFYEV